MKASSRQNPFIRFEQEKELFRNALIVEELSNGFDDGMLWSDFNAIFEVGERVAIIGENGVGKTTLLNTLAGALEQKSGTYKWSENSNIGYYAQDHAHDFAEDLNLTDWMGQWRQEAMMSKWFVAS